MIVCVVSIAAVLVGAFFIYKANQQIRVGVLTPLSGPAAIYGQSILSGAEIAKQLINDQGGVNGALIEIVSADSKCDGITAVAEAIRLLDVNGVVGIVGEACSAAAVPVSSLSNERKFIFIVSAASSPEVTQSPYTFRVNPSDLAQAPGMATYIKNNLNVVEVSILSIDDEYGRGLVSGFTERFSRIGGTTDAVEWFALNDTDFSDHMENLGDPKMLLIIATPSQHPQIAEQFAESGKTSKRMADFNFGVVPEDIKNAAMKGTTYPTVSFDETITENAKFLQERMIANYGKNANIVSAWGFDAMFVLAKAAENCKPLTADCLRSNLIGLSFIGASDENEFTKSGEVAVAIFQFVESE